MENQTMKTIKIGRKEYEVKKGDYILFNYSCYQFCAGDGRILKMDGFNGRNFLKIPQSTVNKISFESLKEINLISNGVCLKKYFIV